MTERRHPEKTVALVVAGVEGKRLRPLITDRCKPAVPFGACYRMVNFVRSNLINSGVCAIYIMVQYTSP